MSYFSICTGDNDWSYLTAEENESLLQFALELERVSDAMRNQVSAQGCQMIDQKFNWSSFT